jgi:hypothetical protein
MRILVAFEDTRFLYRDVLSREIHNSRPKLTVRSAALGKLEEELKSFVPDVVVCSQPIDVHYRAKGAWVKLAPDDGESTTPMFGSVRSIGAPMVRRYVSCWRS